MPSAVAVSLTKVVDWRTKWLSPKRARRWRVEGPVPGAPTLLLGNFDLGEHGYVVEEFFIEGTARSFSEGPDGVQPAAEAEYRTRLVVARPSDPGACSGTVVVEWLNVSGGGDGCPDWAFMHRHIMRTRSAYVAVSAQRVGIEGGGILGDMGTALKQVAPERYATLQHPGDAFAFDMYTQAAEALRNDPALLGGPEPACVIAVGESQSAVFLTTYINKVDALAEVYDAFLVHGRGSRGASLVGEMGVRSGPRCRPDRTRVDDGALPAGGRGSDRRRAGTGDHRPERDRRRRHVRLRRAAARTAPRRGCGKSLVPPTSIRGG